MSMYQSKTDLVDRYFQVRRNPDKMRGLKRAITLHCQMVEREGGSGDYARRHIKRLITSRGGRATDI